jgi:hypothetical protein
VSGVAFQPARERLLDAVQRAKIHVQEQADIYIAREATCLSFAVCHSYVEKVSPR